MQDLGLLEEILPEISRLKNLEQPPKYHQHDVFNHTLKVLDRTAQNIVLRMSALMHDIGKYETYKKENDKISFHGHEINGADLAQSVLSRLKYPKNFIAQVVNIIKNHMYPKMYADDWSDAAVRRFVLRCKDEIDLIMEISEADYGKVNESQKVYALKKRLENLKSKNMLYPKDELLSGTELIAIFEKPEGKWIKTAKEKIEEMRFENPKLTKEEAQKKLKDFFSKEI
jgi:putative nucleotidyltransferase with HDIG domain